MELEGLVTPGVNSGTAKASRGGKDDITKSPLCERAVQVTEAMGKESIKTSKGARNSRHSVPWCLPEPGTPGLPKPPHHSQAQSTD